MEPKINEFAKISGVVNTIVTRYREVLKECEIPDDGWHSRTIERMAKPFLKGCFTLAIVGKVSSGKSTFVNALLGCKDLLPTGHDQTTCGFTYIEYGEKPEVTITFGDGHQQVVGEDVKGVIKQCVAIPEKYHTLPVNNIDDMIMDGADFDKIWSVHEQLEEETLCPPINKSLLQEYVAHRQKKDIAVEVHMKYPFTEELKGWRVIDTPGIGAIGGIETRTRQLLATKKEDGSREVDAIIFLQNGSETLDQLDTKKFVKEQLDDMTDADKERLFYVLTHSCSPDFINYKEKKLDFIKQNYGSKIRVLTYADSLLYTFLEDPEVKSMSLDDLAKSDDMEPPCNWTDNEWYGMFDILTHAKRYLRQNYETINHDTINRVLEEWSNFEGLKKEINDFAKNKKQKTLKDILELIVKDYQGLIGKLEEEKKYLDGGIEGINKAKAAVTKKKRRYDVLAQEADKMITIDKINKEFEFIDRELKAIEKLDSISGVRTAIINLFDSIQDKEKSFFERIAKKFFDFFKDADSDDLILESVDFSAVTDEVSKKMGLLDYVQAPLEMLYKLSKAINSRKDSILPNIVQVFAKPVKEFIDRTEQVLEKKYNSIEEQRLQEFKTVALNEARKQKDKFIPQVKEKFEKISLRILDELFRKIDEESKRLSDLEANISNKEKEMARLEKLIGNSRNALDNLKKLTRDYE